MPKFISENAASKATPAKVIKYVMNEEKCCKDENGELVMSTIGLDNDRPYSQQFRETAELAGNDYKTNDRKYYHFKMTVSPEDFDPEGEQRITPEQLKREAEDFVYKNFPGYQALITVQYHDNGQEKTIWDSATMQQIPNPKANEEHLHAHIVLNASSYEPDKNKIDLSPKDLDNLRDYAYEIGRKYDLNEGYWRDEVDAKLDRKAAEKEYENGNPEPVNLSEGEEYLIERHGKNFADHSWKEQYRIAIDEAKAETGSREGFCDYLKEHFNIDTKITEQGNIKYKLPDRRTYSSGHALGTDYELPAVDAALSKNQGRFENEVRAELKKEEEYYPTPTLIEQQIADFREAFNSFKEWKDNEYTKLRDEWLKETNQKSADEKEYYLNKTVLEKAQQDFYTKIETMANELRSKSEAEAYQEEMKALRDYGEKVKQQQAEILAAVMRAREKEEENERPRSSAIERDREREAYVETLMFVGNSLDEKIRAAESLKQMNIEDGIVKDYQSQAQDIYGMDSRKMNNLDNEYTSSAVKAKTNWKLQAMADSLRLSRENGVNTAAEFKMIVNKKGAELGELRKQHRAAEKNGDVEKAAKLEKEIDSAKKEYSIYARALQAKEEMENEIIRLGGADGILKEYQREKEQELENEIKYLEKRQGYLKEQAKTLDSICRNMKLSLGDLFFDTDRSEQFDDFLKRRNEAYDSLSNTRRELEYAKRQLKEVRKNAEAEQKPEVVDKNRRSKQQAIKEANEQKAELRDWIDAAVEKIGSAPSQSTDADMQAFANEMQEHGCQVRITENTISVKHPNSNQAVRTNRLGDDYTKGAILNGISVQREQNRASEQARNAPTKQRAGRELYLER